MSESNKKNRFIFKFFNSIVFKVSLLYIALAVINIVFFTSIIFENQVDLITDNAKLQAEKFVTAVIASLKKTALDAGTGPVKNEAAAADKIDLIIRPLVREYIIFSETGDILVRSKSDLAPPETYVRDGIKSVANQDFTGSRYYLKIDEKAYKMYFYVPLQE